MHPASSEKVPLASTAGVLLTVIHTASPVLFSSAGFMGSSDTSKLACIVSPAAMEFATILLFLALDCEERHLIPTRCLLALENIQS